MSYISHGALDTDSVIAGAKQMNSEQAKLLAITGQGEKITHLKGGE